MGATGDHQPAQHQVARVGEVDHVLVRAARWSSGRSPSAARITIGASAVPWALILKRSVSSLAAASQHQLVARPVRADRGLDVVARRDVDGESRCGTESSQQYGSPVAGANVRHADSLKMVARPAADWSIRSRQARRLKVGTPGWCR